MKLCTVCGVVTSRAGSRCTEHARQSNRSRHNALYNTRAWQRLSARVLRAWRGQHGNWCPGYQRDAHTSSDLTVDHVVSLAAGGAPFDIGNCAVLCRSCNSTKGASGPDRGSPHAGSALVEDRRQMFQASALGKHDLLTVADFFSERNRAALAALRDAVREVPDAKVRDKLMFGFTAILARASKRYQWSRQRPLNAANQNYYIAPVFYEWNVFDLFSRKIEAIIRADDYIRTTLRRRGIESLPESTYVIASAEELSLDDESVDYVFTDPPFGSNIFYSDMNLFQEAWLGRLTDHRREAVIDRSGNGTTRRSVGRYEDLLAAAFKECWRVLRPNSWLSVVFSNSSGEIWQLLRRSLAAAGFVIEANGISLLDKGQRSVKGLASGVENTVTVDLIISVQKRVGVVATALVPPAESLEAILDRLFASTTFRTPSHVYLGLVRECLRHHWSIDEFGFSDVAAALRQRGLKIDSATGRFIEAPGAQTSIWKE